MRISLAHAMHTSDFYLWRSIRCLYWHNFESVSTSSSLIYACLSGILIFFRLYPIFLSSEATKNIVWRNLLNEQNRLYYFCTMRLDLVKGHGSWSISIKRDKGLHIALARVLSSADSYLFLCLIHVTFYRLLLHTIITKCFFCCASCREHWWCMQFSALVSVICIGVLLMPEAK